MTVNSGDRGLVFQTEINGLKKILITIRNVRKLMVVVERQTAFMLSYVWQNIDKFSGRPFWLERQS